MTPSLDALSAFRSELADEHLDQVDGGEIFFFLLALGLGVVVGGIIGAVRNS